MQHHLVSYDLKVLRTLPVKLFRITDKGSKIVYGTDNGVYISDITQRGQDPVQVLSLVDVMQVDVLEDQDLLIVLAG